MRPSCVVPAAAFLGWLGGGARPGLAATLECTAAALQAKAPAGTTITAAAPVAAAGDLPPYCQVDGTVTTPGNTVNFRLGLPANWNGKFFFQGVGGFAGSIGRLNAGLQRGYASASTDTGHQDATGADAAWALNNRAKEIDYGHRGTHVTTVAAKSLTQSYFGEAPRYAYFSGCSNGGRQALMEAQRYPEDFDGIIAGDPSQGVYGYVQRALVCQTMLSSADRVLPPAKLEVLSKAAVAACDRTDGLTDGLVSDPRTCRFDPAPLLCKGADGPECLTAGQLETVRAVYSDLTLPGGTRILGFPPGHEAGSTGWPAWITGRTAPVAGPDGKLAFGQDAPNGYRFVEGFFHYMAFEPDDPSYDWRTFNLARDWTKLTEITRILSPVDPDLSGLRQRRGKLLLYHGWADPALSAYSTVDYYNKVVRAAGGKDKADDFVRLFLAPGMHHCSGGPGPNTFDSLTALEQWVEKGQAPKQLVASHATEGKVDRTRPLCPEPQVARYVGTGSIDQAENFRCEVPPQADGSRTTSQGGR